MEKLPVSASCDACGMAKVLCSKTRPTCARCASTGLTCVYSPSRKYGEASRRHRRRDVHACRPAVSGPSPYLTPPAQQNALAPLSEMMLPEELESDTSSAPNANILRNDEASLDLTMLHSASWQNGPATEREESLQADWLPPTSSTCSKIDDLGLQSSPNEDISRPELEIDVFRGPCDKMHSPMSISQYVEERQISSFIQQTTWDTLPDASPMKKVASEVHGHSCSVNANKLCIELEQSVNVGSRENQAGTELDMVLERNRAAMKEIEDMLTCNQCLASTSTALSIGSLLGKVLVWYTEAALTVTKRDLQLTDSPDSPLIPANMTQVPLRIGMFSVTRELEQQILTHVIISELKCVERTIEALVTWLFNAPNQFASGHSVMQQARLLTPAGAKLAANTLGQTLRAQCQRAFQAAQHRIEITELAISIGFKVLHGKLLFL